ncbi:TPA: hypothetical protein H1005_03470 [archaeon]|uniref:Uncharacterized protein n=1 Tax=Candidatus Naiadarchaeum limnaeum TaxID=2756139 RepID=A0A832X6D8_9ARCH|nr:hypothetical protein [Candidatus Naiadarchaeales archaeon SRR2090153.bin1042]HIK00770.1 hypothetical protein [Candidatus Naiadarchaeum limnaeum]
MKGVIIYKSEPQFADPKHTATAKQRIRNPFLYILFNLAKFHEWGNLLWGSEGEYTIYTVAFVVEQRARPKRWSNRRVITEVNIYGKVKALDKPLELRTEFSVDGDGRFDAILQQKLIEISAKSEFIRELIINNNHIVRK